jgi:predicted transcriptional regulator
MPRVRVRIPDALLQRAATAAQAEGKKIDDLYEEAIVRYIESTKNASPGSVRSRGGMPGGSPKLIVEISQELFQQADKLAKRLGKTRDILYAEALARHVPETSRRQSALDQGHDLPSGAWRPGGSNQPG